MYGMNLTAILPKNNRNSYVIFVLTPKSPDLLPVIPRPPLCSAAAPASPERSCSHVAVDAMRAMRAMRARPGARLDGTSLWGQFWGLGTQFHLGERLSHVL